MEWGADKLAYIQIDNTGNTPAILQNVTEGLNTSYSLPENVSKSEVYDVNDANNLVIAPNSTETYVVPVFTGISPEFNMADNISIQTADGVQDQLLWHIISPATNYQYYHLTQIFCQRPIIPRIIIKRGVGRIFQIQHRLEGSMRMSITNRFSIAMERYN